MKKYIQTVYILRENIFFLDEWLNYHTKLGIDEFWLYDNSGSEYLDFIGNININGLDKQGNSVFEKTKHLSDKDLLEIEYNIFSKYNVKKIIWQPKDENGKITYNQVYAIYDFQHQVKNGYCFFIDIDEFLFIDGLTLDEYLQKIFKDNKKGVKIKQKRYASRWENPNNVLSINKTFEIDTTRWGSKIIADIGSIQPKLNVNIHNFIDDIIFDDMCYFKHFNHNFNIHKWLLKNYKHIDYNWVPKNFDEIWE